ALTALNACQLGASVLLLALFRQLVGRRWPFAAVGAIIAVAAAGMALAPGPWVVALAGVIGFAAAVVLVLTLALPPLLARPGDVAPFSAGVFLVIYGSSFAGPLVGGAAWDATGWPAAAFLAIAAGGAAMVGLSAAMDLRRRG